MSSRSLCDRAKQSKTRAGAVQRTARDRIEAARSIGDERTKRGLKLIVDPPNISKSLRTAGALLLLTPDPITDIPGVALIGASYVMKRRAASNLKSIADEAREAMINLQSVF